MGRKAKFLHAGLGNVRFFLEDDKDMAMQKGKMALDRNNYHLAWKWFRRYDDLIILEYIRSSSRTIRK